MIIKRVNELLYSRVDGNSDLDNEDSFTEKELNSIKNQMFCQYEVDYCKIVTGPSMGQITNTYAEVSIRKGDPRVSWYGLGRKDGPIEYIHFAIYKLKDEWYIVSWNRNYWKCDQLEGLISCISDNIIKSNIVKESTTTKLVSKIKKNLTPDLLKGIWKNDDPKNYSGYCYVATEALWWMLGGPDSQYSPYVLGNKDWPEVLKKGETHWFLKSKIGNKIIDPTKEQFGNVSIPYEKGHANGMMSYPYGGSKRSKILMSRIDESKSSYNKGFGNTPDNEIYNNEKIDKSEIDFIKKVINLDDDNFICTIDNSTYVRFDGTKNEERTNRLFIKIKDYRDDDHYNWWNESFPIFKLDDEWYMVVYQSEYWKCDQLHGLESFLENEVMKKYKLFIPNIRKQIESPYFQ